LSEGWRDPEGIETERRFFTREAMRGVRFKPDSLIDAAGGEGVT